LYFIARPNPKAVWIGSALLLAPILVLCVQFVDVPLALYVKEHLYGNRHWSRLTSDLPDLLLIVVLVTTLLALSLYLVRTRKGIYDDATSFDKLLAWAAPVSYLAKDVLKSVFGRVNTRTWLQDPQLYRFDWFERRQGFEGFPSGHMLVIVTLLAAAWRFYPRSRGLCLSLAIILGVALIVTDYHFLSDVLAGAYLGIGVEAVVFRMLLKNPGKVGNSAIP
jgi:membrane-associated phospholipid phosphatase